MNSNYNIYCDESCHLENDKIKPMVLGAVWCPSSKKKEITQNIIAIKEKHHLTHKDELKWTKISTNHFEVYQEIIEYFFNETDLHFRGLIIPNKELLDHNKYGQTHDEWYYKMFFRLLSPLIDPLETYSISFDYKDTHGSERINKLHDVLCNNYYDFNRDMIRQILLVKSHHIELMQLTDILIGALSYNFRSLDTNQGKLKIIKQIKTHTKYTLINSTLLRENKFNLFIWKPNHGECHE